MRKILLYGTGSIIKTQQTGGVKRYIELAKYLMKPDLRIGEQVISSDLCCGDDNASLMEYGLKTTYCMKNINKDTYWLIPPEAKAYWHNREILHRIKKEKYDLVIVFDVPPAVGLCLSGINNIVLMIRKDMIGYEKVKACFENKIAKNAKILLQWICEAFVLIKAKLIICQCEYDKEVLLKRHKSIKKIIANKFRIQINNVNPSWIVQNSIDREIPKKKGDSFIVGFIGGFGDLRKGQDLFLKAALSILKTKELNIDFILIGDGYFLESYRNKYAHEKIQFMGYLENPLGILKTMDLLVVPSLADSCPNTILEALYNSIPVIGSRSGGIPEILNNKEAVFDLNEKSIEKKILSFYRDRDKLKKLKIQQTNRKNELTFEWAETICRIML